MASVMEFYVAGEDSNGDAMDADNSIDEIGQSFTIGTTGTNTTFTVSSVNIRIFKAGTPGNLTIDIVETFQDGLPKGAAISTGSIAVGSVTTSAAWYEISMSSATLKANGKYAIILSATTSAGNTYSWRADAGGGYGGGTDLTFNGTVYAAGAGDKMFEIVGGDYAGTLCTLANAINKAGANASTISTNETLVSDYVIQAESFINSATRKNWTDAYSTLNDDVKFLLNQITSSLAAIDIITYDMSGYSSRVEAESMINIYREEVNRALFFLIDKNTHKFMVGE